MTEKLTDVWGTRDFPVLVEVTRRVDEGEDLIVPQVVAGATGLEVDQVRAALLALERRTLVRLDGKDMSDRVGCARDVSGVAYFITGLHPDGDDLAERLVSALQQAAETTTDEEDRSALEGTVRALRGVPASILASVLTAVIAHQTGLSP